jgi:hypothetical protein
MQWWGYVPVSEQLLSDAGHVPYPTASLDDMAAVLTVRDHHEAEPRVIPREHWQFARLVDRKPVMNANYCYLPQGLEPGKVYELTYTASGSPIIGFGFAGYRDIASFLKYGSAEAGNPLAGKVKHTYRWGHSMNGRWLREFLYWGFNLDEQGRSAYDGMMPHTGSSRRGEFNLRFGQPSTNFLRAPGSLYPFAFAATPDPFTNECRGLFDRSRANGSMPKIVHVNSGMEYRWSGASLAHTTVGGVHDLESPNDVRMYYLAGSQHSPGTLPLTNRTVDGFVTQNPINVQDYRPAMRTLLEALDRWVREGLEPPPNLIPRIAAGTAVSRESSLAKLERIPGAAHPLHMPQRLRLRFPQSGEQCEVRYPPTEHRAHPVLVSACDDDFNDLAGVRLPEIAVPLATYTGWNVREESMGGPGLMTFGAPLLGSTLPFPRTRAQREMTGDPRPSIEERYASRDEYLKDVRECALQLVRVRLLLEEDVEHCVRMAKARWTAFTDELPAEEQHK